MKLIKAYIRPEISHRVIKHEAYICKQGDGAIFISEIIKAFRNSKDREDI